MPDLTSPSQSPTPKEIHPEEKGVFMTPDEYIVFERASLEKHDYVNGKAVLRVAGTSPEHNRILEDFLRFAGNVLEDAQSECEAFSSDIKVYVNEKVRFYPDAIIACGNAQFDDKDTLYNPLVIVEVLSNSTRHFDKNGKRKHYQTIASLCHYVLIEQDHVEVIHYEKDASGVWAEAGVHRNLADVLSLRLNEAEIKVPLARIYRRVSFAL